MILERFDVMPELYACWEIGLCKVLADSVEPKIKVMLGCHAEKWLDTCMLLLRVFPTGYSLPANGKA